MFSKDYVEDYEFNVPFRALQALGCKVDAVTPSKKKGEICVTAIHDDEGAQAFSEKRGHNLVITANWSNVSANDYDCLVVPGGRSPELLVMNDKALTLVKEFAEKNRVIAGVGQGQWLLAAAGVLKVISNHRYLIIQWLLKPKEDVGFKTLMTYLIQGKRCASGDGMKVMVKMGGGELEESKWCVSDGKLVTAVGWPALPSFISHLSELLGLSLSFE